jgi:hypothetical protein
MSALVLDHTSTPGGPQDERQPMTSAEVQAIRRDARDRLNELVAVRDLLAPDRDDPLVMSELTVIESQIKAAKEALWPPRS